MSQSECPAGHVAGRNEGTRTKGKESSEQVVNSPSYIEQIYSFPAEEKRLGDLELGVLFNGVWEMRRLVYSKELIAFARLREDFLLDAIPLAEIMGLELLDGLGHGANHPDEHQKFSGEQKFENAFQIRTSPSGYNSGRKYCLQASSEFLCNQILENLSLTVKAARERADGKSRLEKIRDQVHKMLESSFIRAARTWIILANLMLVAVEVHLTSLSGSQDGLSYHTVQLLENLNLFFTVMFAIELLLNLFGNWFLRFVKDFWSDFDLVIITLSLIALAEPVIPANVVRALRVLRLLNNVQSLEKIIVAVSNSIIPMFNAFMIVFAFAFLYSILGVYFFQNLAPELFGGLGLGFITMFRITAGEGQFYFDQLPSQTPDGSVNTGTVAFIGTYIIVVIWIFLQVSVAVLLDNFIQASARRERLARAQKIEDMKNVEEIRSPLESLLVKLVKGYIDDVDLSSRLRTLYKVLDSDGSGSLSSEEFCAAMKRLDLNPRCHMSQSDYFFITQNGKLCDEFGGVGVGEFETIMIAQVRQYTQSRLSDGAFSEYRTNEESEFTQLAGIKMILMELLRLDKEQKDFQNHIKQVLNLGSHNERRPCSPRLVNCNNDNSSQEREACTENESQQQGFCNDNVTKPIQSCKEIEPTEGYTMLYMKQQSGYDNVFNDSGFPISVECIRRGEVCASVSDSGLGSGPEALDIIPTSPPVEPCMDQTGLQGQPESGLADSPCEQQVQYKRTPVQFPVLPCSGEGPRVGKVILPEKIENIQAWARPIPKLRVPYQWLGAPPFPKWIHGMQPKQPSSMQPRQPCSMQPGRPTSSCSRLCPHGTCLSESQSARPYSLSATLETLDGTCVCEEGMHTWPREHDPEGMVWSCAGKQGMVRHRLGISNHMGQAKRWLT